MKGVMANIQNTEADTQKKLAEAQKAAMWGQQGQQMPQQQEPLALQRALADINETNATAQHKRATAYQATVDAQLAPHLAAHNAMMERANFHKELMDSEAARLSQAAAQGPQAA